LASKVNHILSIEHDEENNKVDTTIKDALEYYDINCDKY
jgi:hypothetical protein